MFVQPTVSDGVLQCWMVQRARPGESPGRHPQDAARKTTGQGAQFRESAEPLPGCMQLVRLAASAPDRKTCRNNSAVRHQH